MNPEEEEFAEAGNMLQSSIISGGNHNSFPISPMGPSPTDTVFGKSSYTMVNGEPWNEAVYTIRHEDLSIELSLGHPMITSIEGSGGDSTGRLLWPAAVAFSYWLCGKETFDRWLTGGRGNTIEIAAGCCAMPGIALAGRVREAVGEGKVTVTELEMGVALSILRENVEKNREIVGDCLEVLGLDVNEGTDGKKWDTVIGCECVFDGLDPAKTASTIRSLLKDADGSVLIAGIEEGRGGGGWKAFDDEMARSGLHLCQVEKIFEEEEFVVRIYSIRG